MKQISPSHGFWTPIVILRLEGVCTLLVAALVFHRLGFNWWHFGLLFFLPDLSMVGYLGGKKIGAALYNLGHTYIFAVLLGVAGWLADYRAGMAAGLVWVAHIGFDRCLGYGLKHATGFGDTHLGTLGRHRGPQ